MASRFRRRLVLFALFIYTIFVLTITISPQMPGTGLVSRAVDWLLYELHSRGLLTSVGFLHIEFVGNIIMFVPLGIFAALLLPRKAWWLLLILGTAFSVGIELFQSQFLPGRFPEIRDVISNTTGFLLGAAFSVTLRLMVSYRDSLVEKDRKNAEAAALRGSVAVQRR
ncbi:VanZ family protein [Conyzicola sp.]|uniref:VanZ family protein n=1 Tax=Conyzicola sp. TaxID=1969404 RepID=UPI003988D50E